MCIENSITKLNAMVCAKSHNHNGVTESDSDLFENSDTCSVNKSGNETTKHYYLKIMYLSVQVLLSKHDKLLSTLHELVKKNCAPDIIILGESFF